MHNTQRLNLNFLPFYFWSGKVLWVGIVLGCQTIGICLRLLGNGADGWNFKGKIGPGKDFFFFFFNGFVLGLMGRSQVMYHVRSYGMGIAKRSVLGF